MHEYRRRARWEKLCMNKENVIFFFIYLWQTTVILLQLYKFLRKGRNFGSVLWVLAKFATIWSVWLERNRRIFEEKESSLEELLEKIDYWVSLWASAHKELGLYPFFDWIRGWHLLLLWIVCLYFCSEFWCSFFSGSLFFWTPCPLLYLFCTFLFSMQFVSFQKKKKFSGKFEKEDCYCWFFDFLHAR